MNNDLEWADDAIFCYTVEMFRINGLGGNSYLKLFNSIFTSSLMGLRWTEIEQWPVGIVGFG